ncbi:HNH endonuclease [Tuwongella immobilis]|uniref:HNH domain-containing protein n=1 Tax=Tuwongella immobilis TaxID=692036 RepID=A0A6C2YJ14_9BACT|nr:HNH endonuclease [Tuwongella immobilis]VIP00972.1 hnh endonuclease : Uncharacterized protein OS=Microscilla marina ATCC 23134 GN=M23134_03976 PE=4 SV=1: HNH [Tuwongella immobilis]VTR97362.1 hnh endonuclease : Uncharacterized protein OS=Microscilla marina ATCC 23134 GN=M23134_03976 PE=4 SV=1: HNH [Tuwongella immobilis]
MSKKKALRAAFREAVFSRAKHRCECCGVAGFDRQAGSGNGVPLDAHHIEDRHTFAHGGYVLENGIAVCDDCHLKAEAYHMNREPEPGFWPHELYAKIGSSHADALAADAEHAERPSTN